MTTIQKKHIIRIIIVLLWITTIYAAFWAAKLYIYEQNHPNNEYYYGIWEEMPEEAAIKVDYYGKARNGVYFGLLLLVGYFILDYLEDPEHHFFTPIRRFIEKINEEEEHDENK